METTGGLVDEEINLRTADLMQADSILNKRGPYSDGQKYCPGSQLENNFLPAVQLGRLSKVYNCQASNLYKQQHQLSLVVAQVNSKVSRNTPMTA